MGRLPMIEYEDASPELRALYDHVRSVRGKLVNVYKTLANHPQALAALWDLLLATYRSGSLSRRHQELAYLYTSTLNQCHY